MAVSVPVTVDARRVLQGLKDLDRDVFELATRQALNRTVNNMRSVAVTEAAQWMGVKKRDFDKRKGGVGFDADTKVGKLSILGATRGRAFATLRAFGRPFNLGRWVQGESGTGVTANAWGDTKFYRGVFLGNKRRTAFKRGAGKAKRNARRQAIEPVWGPGLTHAMGVVSIAQAILKEGEARFEKHLISAANFRLERAGWRVRASGL